MVVDVEGVLLVVVLVVVVVVVVVVAVVLDAVVVVVLVVVGSVIDKSFKNKLLQFTIEYFKSKWYMLNFLNFHASCKCI